MISGMRIRTSEISSVFVGDEFTTITLDNGDVIHGPMRRDGYTLVMTLCYEKDDKDQLVQYVHLGADSYS